MWNFSIVFKNSLQNKKAPSGSLGPVYWATYRTSLSDILMLTRLGFTSKPNMLDTTFAVSWWPIADSTSVGISSGVIFLTRMKFIASTGNIVRLKAFTRMCFAIILSPFLVPLNSEVLSRHVKIRTLIVYHTLHKKAIYIQLYFYHDYKIVFLIS
jgi:hypothetical protein